MKEKLFISEEIPSDYTLEMFEELHPSPLRWDLEYKKECLNLSNYKGFWLINYDTKNILSELIISWENESIANLDSIGTFLEYRKRGYSKVLLEYSIGWLKSQGFLYYEGNARKEGGSWALNKQFGAIKIDELENYHNTGEIYIHYKIKL